MALRNFRSQGGARTCCVARERIRIHSLIYIYALRKDNKEEEQKFTVYEPKIYAVPGGNRVL